MKVRVYAKLNLSLNVLGIKDGFHLIDSVVTSVGIYDVVEVNARKDGLITVNCEGINKEDNAAYKAAVAFKQLFNCGGVDIYIEKGIPQGAGMGGSSADIAAVVYCMCSLFGVENGDSVYGLCKKLGSDVNFMLRGGFARMRGKGDDVEHLDGCGELYFAVTTFAKSNSTAQVYAACDALEKVGYADNEKLISKLKSSDNDLVLGNCLQNASESLSDYASEYLAYASKLNLKVNMTGSGSAYYAAFSSLREAEHAANMFNAQGFSSFVCRSVNRGIEKVL